MQIDVKILLRRVIGQLRRPSLLYRGIKQNIFPDKPTNQLMVESKLYGLESELKERNIRFNFGSLYTLPHPKAAEIYRRFIKYNPSNLGSWSDTKSKKDTTTEFEYEVIHQLIDLYDGNHQALEGYITSGGTEGNIFSLWLGRTYFEKFYKKSAICLLRTSLTHYSIRKAGQICSVSEHMVPLNKKDWNMDADGFRLLVKKLYKDGFRAFLVPLTLGYTATGTSDDIDLITKEAKAIEKEFKDIKFFFWIDAAFNGLVVPFIQEGFKPFKSLAIQTFVVDFHKFGLVPYSAGIVLYKNSLKKLIDQPIDYLSETDSTLLGSRPGLPAISIWTMIHSLGKNGYKKIVEKQKINKEYFIEQLKLKNPKIEIITHDNNLSCGLIFHGLKGERLPNWIEEKYSLYPGKMKLLFYPNDKKELIIYKYFFLPHAKKKYILEFMNDLDQV